MLMLFSQRQPADVLRRKDLDGYDPVAPVLSRHGAALHIPCLDMADCETPEKFLCSPEGLFRQRKRTARVLLLAFHDTENVHVIVSAHDGHAAFMQMLPYPLVSEDTDDVFFESRPLLAMCGDSSWVEILDREETASDDAETETVVPTHVNVYSLSFNIGLITCIDSNVIVSDSLLTVNVKNQYVRPSNEDPLQALIQVKRMVVVETENLYKARKEAEANHKALCLIVTLLKIHLHL
ncbi:hypothetical protein HA466_0064450 [Hirschfeldia incana]|nr:hypothetical protein HA466_0064450 [Hirschfeldia incana]